MEYVVLLILNVAVLVGTIVLYVKVNSLWDEVNDLYLKVHRMGTDLRHVKGYTESIFKEQLKRELSRKKEPEYNPSYNPPMPEEWHDYIIQQEREG